MKDVVAADTQVPALKWRVESGHPTSRERLTGMIMVAAHQSSYWPSSTPIPRGLGQAMEMHLVLNSPIALSVGEKVV